MIFALADFVKVHRNELRGLTKATGLVKSSQITEAKSASPQVSAEADVPS
jgi:hypothetical protein